MNARIIPLIVASILLAACGEPAAPGEPIDRESTPEVLAKAQLSDANGLSVGTATLLRFENSGLNLMIEVENISPGEHGFHLHMTGACNPPDFSSAGGHLNPGGMEHGRDNPEGKHLGDLPNLVVGDDGKAGLQVELGGSVEAGLAALMDEDGTAVVIHAEPDDYVTDPSGNAGQRIACGSFSTPS